MELGVATHFAQGWDPEIIREASMMGVAVVRDELHWDEIETAPGEYSFTDRGTLHPDWLAARGIEVRLVFTRHNKLYDDGHTPHTPAGLRAHAEFVAAALRRFPNVRTIEIGNEFNAANFVSGPVADAPYAERGAHYAALLRAVAERVRAEFPDVRILGGASHSIAVDYLRATFDAGALAYSDGIAVHPYTSPPEHIASHLALLRAAMGERPQPVHATEFGAETDQPQTQADLLIKMVSAMAADGVSSATWYALLEQPWSPGMELMGLDGQVRPAGKAFAMATHLLALGPVRRLPSDPFTHLYLFGETALVAWGAPRSIALRAPARWLGTQGELLSLGPRTLDPDAPIIAIATESIRGPDDVTLGAQAWIADSYFQFDVSPPREPAAGRWSYAERRGDGREAPLETMGGGGWSNEPWRPYLGGPARRPLTVDERHAVAADFGGGVDAAKRYAVVERFMSPRAADAILCGDWRVAAPTVVDVALTLNGERLIAQPVTDRLTTRLAGVPLAPGDVLEVEMSPNAGSAVVARRVAVLDAGQGDGECPSIDW